jgi:hypothetical protein
MTLTPVIWGRYVAITLDGGFAIYSANTGRQLAAYSTLAAAMADFMRHIDGN